MDIGAQPVWWTERETVAWNRVKDTLSRDWAYTRHYVGLLWGPDPSAGADEFDRPVLERAIRGRETRQDSREEAGVRFGFGVGMCSRHRHVRRWSAELARALEREWEVMHPEHRWEDVRVAVRYGWTRARPTME